MLLRQQDDTRLAFSFSVYGQLQRIQFGTWHQIFGGWNLTFPYFMSCSTKFTALTSFQIPTG